MSVDGFNNIIVKVKQDHHMKLGMVPQSKKPCTPDVYSFPVISYSTVDITYSRAKKRGRGGLCFSIVVFNLQFTYVVYFYF